MDISILYGWADPDAEYRAKEPYFFKYLKECGWDACDYGIGGHMFTQKWAEDDRKAHFTAAKEAAKEAGMYICHTHSDFSGHPRDYNFDIDEIVERQIYSIQHTAWLDAKYCVVHPIILPGRRYEDKLEESIEKTLEFYKRLTPYLEKYDVIGCTENMWVVDPYYKNICATICSRAQEMVDICNELGDRWKICVDTGHGELTQDDPVEMVKICGDKLATLHCHDTNCLNDLHTMPFTPHKHTTHDKKNDWEKFSLALKEVGYKGTLFWEAGPPGAQPINKPGLIWHAKCARYIADYTEDNK